jgi:hypothetical protein
MRKKLRDELLISCRWSFFPVQSPGRILGKLALDWPLIRTLRKVATKGVTYFHFVEYKGDESPDTPCVCCRRHSYFFSPPLGPATLSSSQTVDDAANIVRWALVCGTGFLPAPARRAPWWRPKRARFGRKKRSFVRGQGMTTRCRNFAHLL